MNAIHGVPAPPLADLQASTGPFTDTELRAIRAEMDAAEKHLPGYYNRLNFFHDSESGDWIATHWHTDLIWHTGPADLVFSRRNRDPHVVLSALREHIAGLVKDRRAA